VKRNIDEYLERGREILFKQLECIEAMQTGKPMPHVPLPSELMEELERCLTHVLQTRALEIKILATMHKWPPAAVQMWLMRAQDAEEREQRKLAGTPYPGEGN
jgi:hypothetical protein